MGYRSADALGCREILDKRIVGDVWPGFKRAARGLVDGVTDAVLVYGFYGAGKTLLCKRFQAEWSFVERSTVTVYVQLRGLIEEHPELLGVLGSYGFLHVAARYTLELMRAGKLCSDNELMGAVKKVAEVAREVKQRNPKLTVADTLEKVVQRVGQRVVLVVDELEQLILGAVSHSQRTLPHSYLVRELRAILGRLYRLLNGGHSYGVLLTSTYRLASLAYEAALTGLALRREAGRRGSDLVQELRSLASALSEYTGPGALGLASLIEALDEEAPEILEKREVYARKWLETQWQIFRIQLAGEYLEPGLSTRLGPYMIALTYKAEDYRELLQETRAPRIPILEELLPQTIEANQLPPRILQDLDLNLASMKQRLSALKTELQQVKQQERIELNIPGLREPLSLQSLTGLHSHRIRSRLETVEKLLDLLLEAETLDKIIAPTQQDLDAQLRKSRRIILASAYLVQPLPTLSDTQKLVLGPPLYYPTTLRISHTTAAPYMPRWRLIDAFKAAIYAAITA